MIPAVRILTLALSGQLELTLPEARALGAHIDLLRHLGLITLDSIGDEGGRVSLTSLGKEVLRKRADVIAHDGAWYDGYRAGFNNTPPGIDDPGLAWSAGWAAGQADRSADASWPAPGC